MEGLIPMVFRTIQRSRTRRHYQYLSSSSAAATAAEAQAQAQRYNIADFYPTGEYVMSHGQDAERDKVQHRRHKSHSEAEGDGAAFDYALSPRQSKKLVRFRSHRLFSCVSGAP